MNECRAFACAHDGCQATIHLHHDIEAKLRRTHERFYCPAGHSNYFPGKTDEERKIEGLQHRLEHFRGRWNEALEQRDEWKLQARRCPLGCGYRVLRKWKIENIEAALAMHLVDAHGATMLAPEEAEVA